jgi:hypothetical protein
MKMRFAFLVFAWVAISGAMAQDPDLPNHHEAYHYIDRLDIKGLVSTVAASDSAATVNVAQLGTKSSVPTDIRPYSRSMVSKVFQGVNTSQMSPRALQWHELIRASADDQYAASIQGKGILKQLYKNKRDFFAIQNKDITLYANPIIHLNAGQEMHNYTTDLSNANTLLYRNSRGAQVRGTLFGKVGFFSEFSENQHKTQQFVRSQFARLGVYTGENFVKTFDQTTDNAGFDFFNARGYLTYSPAKQVRFKLGRDRMQLGNGLQSLLLSDNAADHFFLNINWKVWKLEYVNHFAMMTDYLRGKPDSYGTHPKKFAVVHQLFYRPKHWLSVGVFESVAYSPTLPGGVRGFELEYLNPIIFYRSVEQSLGSPDNSMLGLTWKINFLQRFQTYGQVALDDFNWRNRALGPGSWGNKYGLQAGLKYIDAFWIPRLDLQIEANSVRPYTYSHFNPSANWAHYGQPLAHPLGANVRDVIFLARYQPLPRWTLMATYSKILTGFDLNGDNYGGNIFLPYTTHVQDYNNVVGQGGAFHVTQLYGKISYRILGLDAFAELEGRFRKENENRGMSLIGSFRINMPDRPIRY